MKHIEVKPFARSLTATGGRARMRTRLETPAPEGRVGRGPSAGSLAEQLRIPPVWAAWRRGKSPSWRDARPRARVYPITSAVSEAAGACPPPSLTLPQEPIPAPASCTGSPALAARPAPAGAVTLAETPRSPPSHAPWLSPLPPRSPLLEGALCTPNEHFRFRQLWRPAGNFAVAAEFRSAAKAPMQRERRKAPAARWRQAAGQARGVTPAPHPWAPGASQHRARVLAGGSLARLSHFLCPSEASGSTGARPGRRTAGLAAVGRETCRGPGLAALQNRHPLMAGVRWPVHPECWFTFPEVRVRVLSKNTVLFHCSQLAWAIHVHIHLHSASFY